VTRLAGTEACFTTAIAGLRLEIVGAGGLASSAERDETPMAVATGTLIDGVAVTRLAGTEAWFTTAIAGLRPEMEGAGGLMVKEMPEETLPAVVTVMLAAPALAIKLAGTTAESSVALE
jgi:hypothetical protein